MDILNYIMRDRNGGNAYMQLRLLFCLLLLMPFATQVHAQDIRFKEPEALSELSGNPVYQILQDKEGHIWFASHQGLYKYDGNTLERYQNDHVNGKKMPVGPVINILLAHNNHLWVNIFGIGLVDIDLSDESFTDYTYSPFTGNKNVSSTSNLSLTEDRKGNIWIGTKYEGLSMWQASTKTFIRYLKQNTRLPSNKISCLYTDHLGRVLIGSSEKGPYFFDSVKTDFYSLNIQKFEYGNICCFYEDHKGNMWLNDNKAIYRLNLKTNELKFIIGDSFINSGSTGPGPIFECNGYIWIGSYASGLYLYNEATGQISHFVHNDRDIYSLNADRINYIFKDRSGNIWIGSGSGVMKISPVQWYLPEYRYIPGETNSLAKGDIRALYQDKKGNLWVGTAGNGLNKISPQGRYNEFYFNRHLPLYGLNYVNSIYPFKDNLLILCTENGLRIFDTKQNIFLPLSTMLYGMPLSSYSMSAWSVLEFEGKLYVGSKFEGIWIADAANNTLKHYSALLPAVPFSVWTIFQDRNKNIWLGTSDGIKQLIYSKAGIKFLSFPGTNERQPNYFSIVEDSKGYLWLGSSDAGLKYFDPLKHTFKAYSVAEGLPGNIISSILPDSKGRLWLGTAYGICLFDPSIGRVIRKYTQADGLVSNNFTFKSAFYNTGGEMFFGSNKGISHFIPDSLKLNTYDPDIFITGFKTLTQSLNISRLTGEINLPYSQNTFFITFSNSDYTNPDKVVFEYTLDGSSDKWTEIGNGRSLTFTNLSPGNYILKIRSSNSDGIWGTKVASLPIIIITPWWLSWWFYALILLCIIFISYYILNSILKQKNLKKAKVQAELSVLRAQLNPHFIFNSLSSLQRFIARKDNEMAMDYLIKFSRLMRVILEESLHEFTPLQKEIDFISLYTYMESIRLKYNVIFEIDVDPHLNTNQVCVPTMIVQPLIENAIIHGLVGKAQDGKIILRFLAGEQYLLCQIEDNGVGMKQAAINKAEKHATKKSLGLKLVSERITILSKLYKQQGGLTITDLGPEGGQGTRIELRLPYVYIDSTKNNNDDQDPNSR